MPVTVKTERLEARVPVALRRGTQRCLYFVSIFLIALSLHAEEPQGLSGFLKAVADACEKQDFSAIRRYSYEVDVPQNILDESRAAWKPLLSGDYPEKGWRFKNCSFRALESLKNTRFTDEQRKQATEEVRKSMEQGEQAAHEIYRTMTEPFLQDGRFYEYNLKVVGLVILHFENGKMETGRAMPVGVSPSGDIRFTLLKDANR